MSDSIKNNVKVGVEIESTEGTYVAPQATTSYVSPLADGVEISMGKETLERNNLNSSIGKNTPRTGMRSVSGSLAVEAKAHGTAGSEPEYGPLLKAALGAVRQNTAVVTTKSSGNTATVLQIEDADIGNFAVGDIVMVKQSGAYHVSPITAVDTTGSAANVTMLVAHPSGDCTDSVTVEKFSTYYTANSGHPTLSISKYIEDARLEQATGCRVTSLALNNFSTGQLADFSFSFEGLDFSSSLTAPPYTPSYNSALPPVVLSAYVYVDGTAVAVNDISWSLENSVAFKTSTQSSSGRVSSRISERKVSGSFNPYKQDDSIANYTKFINNTEFSMFGYMAVPTSTAGEFEDVVAFYMPKCVITELSEGDKDGMLQENISFTAGRGTDGSSEEIYITTI
jgi:hypothetical protein